MFIILGIMLGILIFASMKKPTPVQKKPCSTGHKWVYIKQPDFDLEYLQCERCNKYPGIEEDA